MPTKRYLEVVFASMTLAIATTMWLGAIGVVLVWGAMPAGPNFLANTIAVLGWIGRIALVIMASAPLVYIAVRIQEERRLHKQPRG